MPDWVRAAAGQSPISYAPETSAVVLLDDTTLTIGTDGKAVEHNRHVLRILRPAGREQGLVHVPFDTERKLLSLHVWSIGPDGREYQVKDNEMVEIGYPGSGNYYEDAYQSGQPAGARSRRSSRLRVRAAPSAIHA